MSDPDPETDSPSHRAYGDLSAAIVKNAWLLPPVRKSWRALAAEMGVTATTVYNTLRRLRADGKVPDFRSWSELKAIGGRDYLTSSKPVPSAAPPKPKPKAPSSPSDAPPERLHDPEGLMQRLLAGEMTLDDLKVSLGKLIVDAPHSTKARSIEILLDALQTTSPDYGPPAPATITEAEARAVDLLIYLPRASVTNIIRTLRGRWRQSADLAATTAAALSPPVPTPEAPPTTEPNSGHIIGGTDAPTEANEAALPDPRAADLA